MKKNKRGRRRGRKNSPQRHTRRAARRNYYAAGPAANRPRKNRRRGRKNSPRRHRRHHYRSNPQLLGFTLPPFDVVAWSAAGLIAPGMVSGWIMPLVPDTWKLNADGTPNQVTNFAVKGVSVLLPSMLVRSMVSRRGGNIMLVAGAASLILQGIKTFAPTFAAQIGLAGGVAYQPYLGSYIDGYIPNLPAAQPYAAIPGSLSAYSPSWGPGMPSLTAATASRLDPSERF